MKPTGLLYTQGEEDPRTWNNTSLGLLQTFCSVVIKELKIKLSPE